MIPIVSIAESTSSNGWFVLPFLGLAIGWRILMDRCDRIRIRDTIVSGGGHIVDISWNPFGKGWFGERGDRIYDVTYVNRAGHTVSASCKTSMFSGVYWSSDTAPSDFSPPNSEFARCPSCGARIFAAGGRCPMCEPNRDGTPPGKVHD